MNRKYSMRQITGNTSQNVEGITMSATIQTARTITTVTGNNSKFRKYSSLQDEFQSLEEQLKANRAAQNELVLTKIQSLQAIGRSVYRKCTSGSSADLGELSWIHSNLRLKKLTSTDVILADGRFVRKDGAAVFEESAELRLDRAFLHISDRDFAKLVRAQIRISKDARRAEAKRKADSVLRNAQEALNQARAAANIAERKLKEIEASEAEKVAAAEARAARKAARAERSDASELN